MSDKPEGFIKIKNARPLLILGDTVTTDHISPAGTIQKESPTGEYFMKHQIHQKDFNSYGARRGNHEVMIRGAFGNIRIRNEMVKDKEGGYTKIYPEGKITSVYDAAMEYKKRKEDLLKLEKIIMPLLKNLQKNPDDVYIKWPNRKEVIEKQIKKIVAITRS